MDILKVTRDGLGRLWTNDTGKALAVLWLVVAVSMGWARVKNEMIRLGHEASSTLE